MNDEELVDAIKNKASELNDLMTEASKRGISVNMTVDYLGDVFDVIKRCTVRVGMCLKVLNGKASIIVPTK